MVGNTDAAAQSLRHVEAKLDALVAGIAKQTDLTNRKFDQVIAGLDNQSDLLNRKLNRIIEGVFGGSGSRDQGSPGAPGAPLSAPREAATSTLREAMQRIPLLLAE